MRVLRLQTQGLARLRDLDVELAPGLTVVRGPNEAGKSTFQRALELALFKKPTATGAELDALRSWGSGDDDRTSVRLEFIVEEEDEDSGDILERRGVLEKEFRGQRGRVLLDYNGSTCTDPARADRLLADLTGVPTEAFFRSTASIRHQELDDLDRDEGALRDRLQSSIGGGDRGSSRAKKRLDEALRLLKARGGKNPGRLKVAEETVAQAAAALQIGETALARLEHDRNSLAAAREERVKADAGLLESRSLLDAARQAERLRTDQATVGERYERYRQAVVAQERIHTLRSTPLRPLAELRASLDRLHTLQSRVDVLSEQLRNQPPLDHVPRRQEPSFAVPLLAGLAFVAVGLVLAGFGLQSRSMLPLLASGLVAAAGLLVVVVGTARRQQANVIRRENEVAEARWALARQQRIATEEGLRVQQAAVASILRELGVKDVGGADQLLSEEQLRREEIATLQARIAALLGKTPPEQALALRDAAALELEQKTAALHALGPIATDPRAREQLEAEVRERQARLERARDAEAGAAARVEANPVDAEQIAGEAERLELWREQLDSLRRRARIYEATLASIELAERLAMRKATRFLEQHMGRDVARLTGGRYRRVRVDDRSLDIEVFAPDRADWVGPARLSKGTVDQLYLAARLGLVRLVTEGKRPPLILDDPFVTFDDARAARGALLLRDLAADFQVIYLTCSNRYDELADAVVELPGPVELDGPGPLDAAAAAQPAVV